MILCVSIRETAYTVEELIAMMLEKAREIAENFAGKLEDGTKS